MSAEAGRGPRLLAMGPEFTEYVRDESRLTGEADSISFPTSEPEIREILGYLHARGVPVTVQGARTGITGGAVPRGGHILNLSRFNRVLGLGRDPAGHHFIVRVEPGLVLQDLNELLEPGAAEPAGWSDEQLRGLRQMREAGEFFFSPDPTETSASLGGMAASNASGARSFFYGPIRRYVRAVRVVLADGSAVALQRGEFRAAGRQFRLPCEGSERSERSEPGGWLCGRLPNYRLPRVKNAAGYWVEEDMDLLDLFIGSEGTLGVISELTLLLLPKPRYTWGLLAFLPEEHRAVEFVQAVRAIGGDGRRRAVDLEAAGPETLMGDSVVAALEYFDARALGLLESQRQSNPAFAELPKVPLQGAVGVYVELQGNEEGRLESRLLEVVERLLGSGGSEESSWMATTPTELQRLKDYRHALPEAVNLLIDERRRRYPQLTKLGTDMAVPDADLGPMMSRYREDLRASGLEAVKFGHIGDNHIHVNILPADPQEYEAGKRLYEQWAEEVVARGGSVSAEHGIGKLKLAFLRKMYGEQGVEEMRQLRRVFDPGGLLNRGNLTEP
jgi:D-lactate dehydrogenase (cytochrome)